MCFLSSSSFAISCAESLPSLISCRAYKPKSLSPIQAFKLSTAKTFLSNFLAACFAALYVFESFEEIDLAELFNLDIVIDAGDQIMSYLFKIIEKAKKLDLPSGYAYLLKTYYYLTLTAKKFYYDKKEKGEDISNLFYFGI